jgi:hypothetical protein
MEEEFVTAVGETNAAPIVMEANPAAIELVADEGVTGDDMVLSG